MNMQVNNTSFSNLPSDLQQVILSQLETPDQFKIRRVCKEWQGRIDAMLDRPANQEKAKRFAVNLWWNQYFSCTEESVIEQMDEEEGAYMLGKLEEHLKPMMTQHIDDFAQSFSLPELIGAINLQKLQAWKNLYSNQNIGMGSEADGDISEQEIDPSKRKVALEIVDEMFSVVKKVGKIADDVDSKDSVQDSVDPERREQMQSVVLSFCARFSIEELQEIRELFNSPAMATQTRIMGLMAKLDCMNPYCPEEG